jgi:hypothetical protein
MILNECRNRHSHRHNLEKPKDSTRTYKSALATLRMMEIWLAHWETWEILTTSPVCGAWISRPSPMAMPTCPGWSGVPLLPGMNSRSPGWIWLTSVTAVPA